MFPSDLSNFQNQKSMSLFTYANTMFFSPVSQHSINIVIWDYDQLPEEKTNQILRE